jgi:hypothetical protein
MPMLVIQFINNYLTNRWSNIFVISSFVTSVVMVVINSLKLVITLYYSKIIPIIKLLKHLEVNLKKTRIANKQTKL